MSVLNTVQAVISCVIIPLVVNTVHVTLVTGSAAITGHVLVCVMGFKSLFLVNVDINECDTSNGGCDTTCTNTVGSYYCSCNTGYELNNNQHTCNG